MNSKVILIIVGVLVLGGVAYFATKSNDTSESAGAQGGAESIEKKSELESVDSEEGFTGSIKGLLGMGKNMRCTFDYTDEYGSSDGTVYVADSGKKIRADFSNISSETGETTSGSMINDGTHAYTWGETDEGVFGMKVAIPEGEDIYDNEDFQASGFDYNNDANYKCSSWGVDNSKFVPPSDVEFTDFAAEMQKMQESFGNAPGLDCSVCDSVPDESAKAQCKQAMGC